MLHKIEWVSPVNEKDIIGNSLGYGLANKHLKDAFSKLIEINWRATTALQFLSPQFYFRVPQKKNFIFTMNEHDYLTPDYKYAFDRCDGIITPSTYCKNVFKQYTDKEIYVVPLGVDAKTFTAKKRVLKRGKKFRWLYCGAPNLRKFSIMEEVWKTLIGNDPNIELYIKTTGADIPAELGDIVRKNNWIVDNRKLPVKDLVKLYHSSHAFLFLSLGEGFGLSLLEAMCTQMPVVFSAHTGPLDFCNEQNSYPVRVDMGKVEVMIGSGAKVTTKIIDCGIPNIISTMTQMAKVMGNYNQATDIARQAAKDARKLSWENSAKILLETVNKLDSPSGDLSNST